MIAPDGWVIWSFGYSVPNVRIASDPVLPIHADFWGHRWTNLSWANPLPQVSLPHGTIEGSGERFMQVLFRMGRKFPFEMRHNYHRVELSLSGVRDSNTIGVFGYDCPPPVKGRSACRHSYREETSGEAHVDTMIITPMNVFVISSEVEEAYSDSLGRRTLIYPATLWKPASPIVRAMSQDVADYIDHKDLLGYNPFPDSELLSPGMLEGFHEKKPDAKFYFRMCGDSWNRWARFDKDRAGPMSDSTVVSMFHCYRIIVSAGFLDEPTARTAALDILMDGRKKGDFLQLVSESKEKERPGG